MMLGKESKTCPCDLLDKKEFSPRDVFNAHKKASNAESNMTGGSYKIHEITAHRGSAHRGSVPL